jgi:multidrug efflux pump subunit AcrB
MATSSRKPAAAQGHGLISLFVRHPTAANLLMMVMVIAGLYSVFKTNTQFFPTIEVPSITVTVVWPGASASDVEANILDAVEPELRFLDDVEEVRSVAREGAGTVSIEFTAQADMQKALADAQQAVDSITTLPDDSEEPVIKRLTFFEGVARLVLFGPVDEQTLKAEAKRIRDGLLNAGIDKVTLSGARDEEIWVKIREADLQRLNLTLGDIAQRIRQDTRDLPSGTLEGSVEMQLRSLAERRTPETIGNIEIKSTNTGEKVLLKDAATVETRFDRDQVIGQRSGHPAIELNVQRSLSADTLQTMKIMNAYLEQVRPTLPEGLELAAFEIRGKFVEQRLGILIMNGLQGLALVLIILFVFLDARIAFWVAAGIPVAFMATLFVMYLSGQTINMVSMFALIMMLGIIVDDAIVVGEETATRQSMGLGRLDSAEQGAVRMLMPVTAATLTTVAAFSPIFLIRDRIGDIMSAIPLVVVSVLVASLIESFLVLPGHLRHGFGKPKPPGRFRTAFDGMLNRFRDGSYDAFVRRAYEWRYTTVAFLVGAFIVCLGLIAGGRVGFTFFPSPESENVTASIVFGAGTPREEQTKALLEIEKSLYLAEKKLTGGKEKLVDMTLSAAGMSGRNQGDNLSQIEVQLTPSEVRTIPTREITRAWRRVLPNISGVEQIAIQERRAGPRGRDIDIQLLDAPVEDLKAAANEVKEALTGFPGVSAIDDDLPYGKQELILEVTPRGSALGFTAENVGTQVRNAFEGAIATRFPRGEEEITVRVMRSQEVEGPYALRQIYLTSPSGNRVPLTEVVTIREKPGFSIIQRRDGVRSVSVTADLDTEVIENADLIAKLGEKTLPDIAKKYNLRYSFKGRAEERAKSFADLQLGIILALTMIYIILAGVFGSYSRPLAVMCIIPFGFVGAILGHMVMGFHLTIISMIGLLGLAGILVNDSIILVSQIDSRLREGDDLATAAVGASRDRLRAVLLTSLTTIGGLTPLLFETSRQAQFLIPMAVTIVFGLMAATILVLILVPSLVGIGGDISRGFEKIRPRLGFTPSRKSV